MSTPTPVPSPAPQSGGSTLKTILIILGVIAAVVILFAGLVIYGCYHFTRKIVQNNRTTVTIPGGASITANDSASYTAADLGTDIYPGAKPEKGGSKISTPAGSMTTGVYSTPDGLDKVEAYYKDKLGSDATESTSGERIILSKRVSKTETVTVTANSHADDMDGRTKIMIAEVTSIVK